MKDSVGNRPDVEPRQYDKVLREVRAALETAANEIEAHETVCGLLFERFAHYSWIGIYVVEDDELILSAYTGLEETEHTRIAIGEGICGLAVASGTTEVVPDVSQRPEFIACFPSTRSEIVVPIHGPKGVLGEIDIDSDWLDAFDDRDRELLEAVAADLGRVMSAHG